MENIQTAPKGRSPYININPPNAIIELYERENGKSYDQQSILRTFWGSDLAMPEQNGSKF